MTEPISHEAAMHLALDLAREAGEAGDVPVGAVLLDSENTVVAGDRNRREELRDPTAHAEIIALRAAARTLGSWRLEGCSLVVTLEPCTMCAGAAVLARLDRIVYGAADLKAGAAWSLYNIPQDRRLNHRVDLIDGVMASQASDLLESFFVGKR